ncbi:MAG: response regulator [Defluviitaleaceae bacterium]|nr:response regulator [Defluviitaleaceae bacterium]
MAKDTILIIEDHLEFANGLANCLQEGGFNTLHTDNIDDALKIIEEVRPSGISLDIQLKGELGLDILKTLTSEKTYDDFSPTIIIVSSFIGLQTMTMLQKYKILYYDKSLPTFKYSLVLNTFSMYLDNMIKPSSMVSKIDMQSPIIPSFPTGDTLRNVISKKLAIYGLNVKATAYKRLIEGVYYTLLPEKKQKNSLSSIYIDILHIDYHTAFTSIKRLLTDSFRRNPTVFSEFYHVISGEALTQSKVQSAPTPSDFIYYIVTEIRKDYV